jgi:mRNA interferase MazF
MTNQKLVKPYRGEVWWIDLDPAKGREQAGRRPGLIISEDIFNFGPAELVVILPITTKDKNIPLHIKLSPLECGLQETSYVKCEDIRSVSKQRLISKIGFVDTDTMKDIEDKVRILLGI